MKEIEIQALQEIAERAGKNWLLLEGFLNELNSKYNQETFDTWILGFLNSKEVLIAYFGDSCWMCCRDIKGHLLHATEEENVKYHGDNLTGLSVEECLEYYRRNKPNI